MRFIHLRFSYDKTRVKLLKWVIGVAHARNAKTKNVRSGEAEEMYTAAVEPVRESVSCFTFRNEAEEAGLLLDAHFVLGPTLERGVKFLRQRHEGEDAARSVHACHVVEVSGKCGLPLRRVPLVTLLHGPAEGQVGAGISFHVARERNLFEGCGVHHFVTVLL